MVRAGELLSARLGEGLRRRHDLTLRSFEVLLFLAVFAPEGSLTISELTDRAPLSQSRVSRLVADLENRGLVVRRPSDDDGRSVRVAITDQGLDRFREAQREHLEDLERCFFGVLSSADLSHLARITSKVIGACET